MFSVVKTLWRLAAMVLTDTVRHGNWKLKRAIEVFLICPILLICHPLLHRRVARVGGLADFRGMSHDQPRFLYKYLNNYYLARGLRLFERAACFINHYHYIQARLESSLLRQLQGEGVVLHRHAVEDRRYEIVLRQAFEYFNEGEWSLCLVGDGAEIYISSFTFVPGSVLKVEAENTVLITRQQGAPRMFSTFSRATKDFMDISPQFVLFAALQGIALSLGLRYVGCVSGTRHISNPQPGSQLFRRPYDDFMLSLGAVGTTDGGFLLLRIPLREKPLKFIKREHRTRAVRKRRFRAQIANAARERMRQGLKAALRPEGPRKDH